MFIIALLHIITDSCVIRIIRTLSYINVVKIHFCFTGLRQALLICHAKRGRSTSYVGLQMYFDRTQCDITLNFQTTASENKKKVSQLY
jgi:hypothetical protein